MSNEFTKKAKITAAAFYEVPLKGNHADHIHPKSKGGTGDLSNIQILKPLMNMKKSNNVFEPRKWQSDFYKEFKKYGQEPFLCTVIPGGGKTLAALWTANEWMRGGPNRQLIVVVPTNNLKEQWRDEAAKFFGVDLKTREVDINSSEHYDGYVVTYQGLDTLSYPLMKYCNRKQTFLILDEPHHCSEENKWGDRIKEIFANTEKKLLLSGTPFRSDGYPIPYVKYKTDGTSDAQFRYDYPTALIDEVVRYISFTYESGEYSEMDLSGKTVNYKLDKTISEIEAAERLRKILNPDGNYVREVIKQVNDKLTEIRQTIPDAAAMALCIDQFHAQRIAAVIKDVTGSEASIIVSDNEIATDTVKQFRNAKTKWLVSVRQVSEGTDIKRLQVLCYLTNYTTELFFRQAIGRIMRVRGLGEGDMDCYCYLPSDPRLISNAKNIEDAQVQALRDEQAEFKRRERKDGEKLPELTVFMGSQYNGTELILINGKEYTPRQAAIINQIVSIGVTTEKATKIYDLMPVVQEQNYHNSIENTNTIVSKEDELHILRKKCNKLVHRIHLSQKEEHAYIHAKFGKSQNTMNKSELIDKLRQLETMYENLNI